MLSAALNAQKLGGFSLAFSVFVIYQLEKMFWKNSRDIVSLCHYCYRCGVEISTLIELEWL